MVDNSETEKQRELALELLKAGSLTAQKLQNLGVSMSIVTGLLVSQEVRFDGDLDGELSGILFSLSSETTPEKELVQKMPSKEGAPAPLKDGVGFPSASVPSWVVTSYRRRVTPRP